MMRWSVVFFIMCNMKFRNFCTRKDIEDRIGTVLHWRGVGYSSDSNHDDLSLLGYYEYCSIVDGFHYHAFAQVSFKLKPSFAVLQLENRPTPHAHFTQTHNTA